MRNFRDSVVSRRTGTGAVVGSAFTNPGVFSSPSLSSSIISVGGSDVGRSRCGRGAVGVVVRAGPGVGPRERRAVVLRIWLGVWPSAEARIGDAGVGVGVGGAGAGGGVGAGKSGAREGVVSSKVRYRASRLFATSSIWRFRRSPSLCTVTGTSVVLPCGSGLSWCGGGCDEPVKKESEALRNAEGSSARSCSMRSFSL